MAVALLLDDRVSGADELDGLDGRVATAALACITRDGLAKTTLGDVAREAGCSRATAYRLFPGGKEALVAAVARREVERVAVAVEGAGIGALTLEGSVSAMLAEGARQILGHTGLAFLRLHEPQAIVGWLAFQGKERLLAAVGERFAPVLERFVGPEEARRVAQWGMRVLLSFCLCPWPGVDLSGDAGAHQFVTSFMFPAR